MITIGRHRVKTSALSKLDKLIFKSKPSKTLQKSRKTWLIHHDNKLAGYILVDESRKNLIKVDKFGVLENYRRCGLMKLAFNVMLSYYDGKMVFVSVPEKSLGGQLFLKNMGFAFKSMSENRENYIFQQVRKTNQLETSVT